MVRVGGGKGEGGWSVGRFVGRLVGWSVGRSVGSFAPSFARSLVGVCVEGMKGERPDNSAKRTKVTLTISTEMVALRHCTNALACILEKTCKQMIMHHSPFCSLGDCLRQRSETSMYSF